MAYTNDSEVNLKIKQALQQTSKILDPREMSQLQGVIKCEQPNNRLYNYDGVLSVSSADEVGKTRDYALDPTQLLLRGAQLRNTSWIYGIAVFTGHETKLMLNSRYMGDGMMMIQRKNVLMVLWTNSKKPSKMSNVTHITNRNILYLFAILVLMSIACSCGGLGFAVSEEMDLASLYIHVSSLHIAYQERPNGLFTIREPKPRS